MDTKKGKDLTKVAPRSPHTVLGGFKILARTIDKCRALLWGNKGEYHFDCPLDNQLFSFMEIKGDDFKKFVSEGHSDEEIAHWVREKGIKKTEAEIAVWNKKVADNNYSDAPDKKKWLEGEALKLGMPKDTTLFDWLDKDDKESLGGSCGDCENCKECKDCKNCKGCENCKDCKDCDDCDKGKCEVCEVK
jgi:hypothetical protein